MTRLRSATLRRSLLLVAMALLPVVIRLALLPWSPAPAARVPDEFSHLLVGDTLASGRLSNPPHPLWRHLETAYVLQEPSYSSIYPIGQGSMLGVGTLMTGHPWAGVLLSVALMSGGIGWMLFGCLPARWAVVGGLLAALHFGLAPQWVDSYWGGALSAFGGALLFGALARLRQQPSMTMGAVLGLGWSIVWLTRPFESLLLFAVVWVTVAALAVSRIRESRRWRRWAATLVLTASVQVLAGALTLLHNHAVTGSPLTLPYQLSQRVYGTPQGFFWQPSVARPDLRVAELGSLYEWQRKQKEDLDEHPYRQFVYVAREAWRFYVTPWYSLPLLMLLFSMRDPKVVLAGILIVSALTVSTLYPFFYSHYVGAYASVIAFLIVQGMASLWTRSLRGIAVGRLAVGLVTLGGASSALLVAPPQPLGQRTQLASRLHARGGRHVAFVEYGPRHSFHDEWVYNGANVDEAAIVWCRSIGALEDAGVMRYYRDRLGWLVTVDGESVRVVAYEPDNAAGIVATPPGR